MTKANRLGTGIVILALASSAGAGERGGSRKPAPESEFTVGLVQKEVRTGMSQADLVTALGAPNILTRDGAGRESWVYDKLATEVHVKSTGFGGSTGGIGSAGSSVLFGLLSGHRTDEKITSTQRTLTVVIRFDADGLVESFAFHSSRF